MVDDSQGFGHVETGAINVGLGNNMGMLQAVH